jgi:hypothetical protein
VKSSEILRELSNVVKQVEDLPKIPIAIATSYAAAERLKHNFKDSDVCLFPLIEIVPLRNFSAFTEHDSGVLEITSRPTLYAIKKVDENFAQLEIKSSGSLERWLKAYEDEYLLRSESLKVAT